MCRFSGVLGQLLWPDIRAPASRRWTRPWLALVLGLWTLECRLGNVCAAPCTSFRCNPQRTGDQHLFSSQQIRPAFAVCWAQLSPVCGDVPCQDQADIVHGATRACSVRSCQPREQSRHSQSRPSRKCSPSHSCPGRCRYIPNGARCMVLVLNSDMGLPGTGWCHPRPHSQRNCGCVSPGQPSLVSHVLSHVSLLPSMTARSLLLCQPQSFAR